MVSRNGIAAAPLAFTIVFVLLAAGALWRRKRCQLFSRNQDCRSAVRNIDVIELSVFARIVTQNIRDASAVRTPFHGLRFSPSNASRSEDLRDARQLACLLRRTEQRHDEDNKYQSKWLQALTPWPNEVERKSVARAIPTDGDRIGGQSFAQLYRAEVTHDSNAVINSVGHALTSAVFLRGVLKTRTTKRNRKFQFKEEL